MQQPINGLDEKLSAKAAPHPRNLDRCMSPCYLPATAFLYLALEGEGDGLRSLLGGNIKKTGLLLLLIATTGWAQSSAQGAADGHTSLEEAVVTTANFPTV